MNTRASRLKAWARFAAALLTAACAAAPAGADDADVRLSRNADGAYEVQGQFSVMASTAEVWKVLTDYEEIPAFVSSMRSSRVTESRGDGVTMVEQVATGEVFFITKSARVTLEVRRTTDRMDFTDVSLADFRAYDGFWQAQEAAGGSLVSYHLRAAPRFPAPGFLMRGLMRREARDLLDQVRAEIQRRRRVP
jgi:carbon monoxide dehydrogenase subunit G